MQQLGFQTDTMEHSALWVRQKGCVFGELCGTQAVANEMEQWK